MCRKWKRKCYALELLCTNYLLNIHSFRVSIACKKWVRTKLQIDGHKEAARCLSFNFRFRRTWSVGVARRAKILVQSTAGSNHDNIVSWRAEIQSATSSADATHGHRLIYDKMEMWVIRAHNSIDTFRFQFYPFYNRFFAQITTWWWFNGWSDRNNSELAAHLGINIYDRHWGNWISNAINHS